MDPVAGLVSHPCLWRAPSNACVMCLKALVMQVLGSRGVSVQRKAVPAGKDITVALRAEAEIPLDPSEEKGVMRATLLEPAANGATQPVLALTLHAVAGAEPSLALLQSQLLVVYAGAKAGGPASIKPGLQFRDVLYWLSQRQEQGARSSFHCTSDGVFSQISYGLPCSACCKLNGRSCKGTMKSHIMACSLLYR